MTTAAPPTPDELFTPNNVGGVTDSLGKKVVVVLVGVLVSSLSEMHSGFDEPDRLGPGEAIDE